MKIEFVEIADDANIDALPVGHYVINSDPVVRVQEDASVFGLLKGECRRFVHILDCEFEGLRLCALGEGHQLGSLIQHEQRQDGKWIWMFWAFLDKSKAVEMCVEPMGKVMQWIETAKAEALEKAGAVRV